MEDTTNLLNITGKAVSGEWGSEDPDGSGIPVLRTTNFTNEGEINYNDVVTRKIVKKNLKSKFLINGDIIIEKSGGSEKQPVGRVVYFDGNENTYLFNNFTGLLRVKDTKKWNSKYVFWSLYAAYKQGRTRLYQNKTTGLHNLKTDVYVRDMQIRNRDIEDQVKIAYTLSKTREIIRKYKEKISKLDELVKARFVEMFGDPVLNSQHYNLVKLSNLGTLARGKSKHRPRNDPQLLGGPYPLIQTGEITNSDTFIKKFTNTYSELGLQQSKLWPKGTLCITIAANIAQTAILTFDACFPDSVVGFIPENSDITPLYLHYWFSFFQKIIDSQASQVAQKNINLKVLSNLQVMLPPKNKQSEFASFVQQVDKSKFENIVYLNKTLSSKILSQLGDAIRD
ncbi:restriction endonuclease subunit S [Lactobacillus sp.]|uniref:restriction endonuclease subunit S n=1 Tax=Lactobacillus sp. TaxID=1591 RepID=UPI0026141A56|nr:restriction endonuclease subunit S [Lactobacillus sp.]